MMNRWEEENLISRIKEIREKNAKEANIYEQAKSWPFQEARNLLKHIERKGKKPGDLVTFETGYGPSGAPHIGTFGEVVRTLWVMRAFRELTENAYPIRLIMFSDDYDAMRKVPDDMPEWLEEHLGKPLSAVPNPYVDGKGSSFDSFGRANNFKLVDFVADILIDYDPDMQIKFAEKDDAVLNEAGVYFCSSTDFYVSGRFNDMLDRVWDNHDAIQAIMLPTLGTERAATYSPFMVKGNDGTLIQNGVTLDVVRGYVQVGDRAVAKIHDGGTKLQWKVDWASRWTYFDVDYEMSGKDLIDSVKASGQICRALGGTPPLNLTYELFLDEHGAKISKSKGNGFTVENWLRYGNMSSLMLFMFQNPRAAKKLYREIVPSMVDQALKHRNGEITPDNPLWHFRVKQLAPFQSDLTYQLLLNLAVVSQAQSTQDLVSYLQQTREISMGDDQVLASIGDGVINYARDKGLFSRERRQPTDQERAAFRELAARFTMMMENMDAEAFQFQVYEVGKAHGFENLRDWFKALYECLLGSSDGPRFGAFTAAYGLQNTIRLLKQFED